MRKCTSPKRETLFRKPCPARRCFVESRRRAQHPEAAPSTPLALFGSLWHPLAPFVTHALEPGATSRRAPYSTTLAGCASLDIHERPAHSCQSSLWLPSHTSNDSPARRPVPACGSSPIASALDCCCCSSLAHFPSYYARPRRPALNDSLEELRAAVAATVDHLARRPSDHGTPAVTALAPCHACRTLSRIIPLLLPTDRAQRATYALRRQAARGGPLA